MKFQIRDPHLFDDRRNVVRTTLHEAASSSRPRVSPAPIMRPGVQPSNACQIACRVAQEACHAAPFIPNFICDAGYNACMGLC